MLPGMGKIDPRKMQAMMRQMGIDQEDIDASKVEIYTSTSKITIENPSVQKITMQGQQSFQISGNVIEEENPKFDDDDIKMIMENASCSKEEAQKALQETKDIAQAIILLTSKK